MDLIAWLLLAAALLLLIELATGTGVASLIGAIAVVGALVVGWEDAPGLAAAGVALLVGGGLLVRRTRQHEGFLLGAGLRVGSGRGRREPSVAPGTIGSAVTALRPGGAARFGDRDIEVHLAVGTAEPGDALVALRTEDGVLVVERAPEGG